MSQHFDALLQSAQYQNSKKQLIQSIQQEISKIKEPKPANPEMKQKYDEMLKAIETHRGRELFYKLCPSGAGNGPFVELADGSIKYDLITGIGVHFFGHGNLEIFESQLDGIWGEVMQGLWTQPRSPRIDEIVDRCSDRFES